MRGDKSTSLLNSVSIQVVGGLGNQLFGLSAGLWASELLGIGLNIDSSCAARVLDASDKNTQRSFELDTLNLPHAGNGTSIEIVQLPYRRQRRGEPRIVRALSRFGVQGRDYWGKPWRVDNRILNFAQGRLLRGNFHTYGYLERLRLVGRDFPLEVKHRSKWAEDLVSRANDSNAIAVHLRLGDYVSLLPELIATDEYFDNAIGALGSTFSSAPIWIFTDDAARAPEIVRRLNWSHRTIEWIVPPEHVSPAELMEVMSCCKAIVTSCSSFSLWAAQFSEPETLVVFPASALTLFGQDGFSSSWISID